MIEQEPTLAEALDNTTETSLALSGKPHHHNAWGYRVPLDTTITLDHRVASCRCTDDAPDTRPSVTRYESDQVRAALKSALTNHDWSDLAVQAIEDDGNIAVKVCSCGPWHPDMDGPDEDCPVHGRSNADLWALAARHQAESREVSQRAREAEMAAQQAQDERLDVLDVLRNLVALKDGPRDAHYEVAKSMAWDVARALVASEKEPSGDTVGTDFHKAIQRLIDDSKANPFVRDLPDLPPLGPPPSEPEPDEVTLIVGPEGRVSQIVFHTSRHLTFEDLEVLSEDIKAGTNALVLGEGARVREFIVTRLPEDEPEVVIEDAQEVPG